MAAVSPGGAGWGPGRAGGIGQRRATVTTRASAPVTVSGGYDGYITMTVKASNPANGCSSSQNSTVHHNRGSITEANNPLQLFVSGFYAPSGSVVCGRPVQLDVSGLDLYGNGLPATTTPAPR